MVAAVRAPDLGNRTPTEDPETPRQRSLTVLLLCLSHHRNDFASREPHLSVQVCSFIHAGLCKTTCYDSPTLYFLSSPNMMTLQLPDQTKERKPTHTMKT